MRWISDCLERQEKKILSDVAEAMKQQVALMKKQTEIIEKQDEILS